MKAIQQEIAAIYSSGQVENMLKSIRDLIEKYQNKTIHVNRFELSEKDVVLITYGDQVYNKGETKLATLNKLLKEQLSNEISIVHILPFYPSSSDDGFSVINYYKVDPAMGSWKDIESLSKDFILLFDAVINHNSSQSGWFKKYLENDSDYKDYYIELTNNEGFEDVVRPRTSPLSHTFESHNGSKTVWTTFSHDQVDLNYSNPHVFIQVLDILLFYISEGARIIRLDAVGFMWKEKDTNCLHLPKTHQLIKLMRKVIEKVDDSVLLLTETNVPHEENISYFGQGNEADMVYNFTLPPLLAYSLLSQDASKLTTWAQSLEVPYKKVCFFNFLASHDGIGVRPVVDILNENELTILIKTAEVNGGKVSYKSNPNGTKTPYEINCNYLSLLRGEENNLELGIKRTILAHAVLLAMPGLPAIYFHSIFGSENDIEGMKTSGINRRINRQKSNYDELVASINQSNSTRNRVLSAIKKLLQVRSTEKAFNPYAPFLIRESVNGVFNITRLDREGKEKLCTYFNFTLTEKHVVLDKRITCIDLLKSETFTGKIKLKPLEFKWLKITD